MPVEYEKVIRVKGSLTGEEVARLALIGLRVDNPDLGDVIQQGSMTPQIAVTEGKGQLVSIDLAGYVFEDESPLPAEKPAA